MKSIFLAIMTNDDCGEARALSAHPTEEEAKKAIYGWNIDMGLQECPADELIENGDYMIEEVPYYDKFNI